MSVLQSFFLSNMGMQTGDQSANISGTESIDSRCIVEFRPNDDWKGEFGFDWYRNGDANENINGNSTASNYENVVGRYDPKDPDYGDSAGILKHKIGDIDYVEKLKNEEYTALIVKGVDDCKYYVPYISLYYLSIMEWQEGQKRHLPPEMVSFENGSPVIHDYCKTHVTIKATIKAKNIERIEFVCDKNISVAPRTISPVSNGDSKEVSITYNYDFDENYKSIKVFALHKDGVTRTFAGQINVVKCNPKAVDICFVNVKIIKTGYSVSSGFSGQFFLESQKKNLRRFFAQAHVIPNITEAELDLDTNDLYGFMDRLTSDGGTTYTDSIIANGIYGNDNFAYKLESLFNQPNMYKVFFVGENGYDLGDDGEYSKLDGHALDIPSKTLVIYRDPDESVVCHELLHCFGLWHSFSNESNHTFEKFKTSNIMDYSKNTYTLWKWQWEKIRDNAIGIDLT